MTTPDKVTAVCERLRVFRDMLFHADALALKPSAPNEVDPGTLITTRESRLLQDALADCLALIESLNAEKAELEREIAPLRKLRDDPAWETVRAALKAGTSW